MSAKEAINRIWPGVVTGLIITVIGVLLTFRLNASRMDAKEWQDKLDEKASKQELRDAVDAIKRESDLRNEYLTKTLDKIDKRTERIEDRLNK